MTDSTMLGRDLRAGAASDTRVRSSAMMTDTVATSPSAVSWGAILAGATAAAALSLILLILGAGLGLSSVSPFSGRGASAGTFGISTIAWLTFAQLAASGMGGYLAGRLRTRWSATHTDEVYYRDTAHGFLAVGHRDPRHGQRCSRRSSVPSSARSANAAGAVAGGAATAATATLPCRDRGREEHRQRCGQRLLRRQPVPQGCFCRNRRLGQRLPQRTAGPSTAEAGRIFAAGLDAGSLPPDDVKYLGQMVSQRTGLAQPDAEKRVNDDFAKMKAKADQAKADAKEAADKARKASEYAALWLFISLLLGAFVASFTATFGGRQRDFA